MGRPARILAGSVADHRVLGVVGSTVIVAGGLMVGVTPVGGASATMPIVRDFRASPTLAAFVVYIGLTTLLVAWWRIGVIARGPVSPSRRELATTAAWWVAPFALVTPIFSGDVYSYVAQGAMTMSGLDVYRVGPAALGGPLAANVPELWQHAPAPYGPVFLELAAAVTRVTGGGVWAGVVGMRLLALLGIAMLVWSVPRLAEHCGVQPAAAVWLGVLNPLILLHLVADAHNDALMLGLMSVGLVLAFDRRPALGVISITLAVLVKAPAVLAVAFVIPIWANQLGGRRARIRATQRAVAVATGAAVTVTAIAGTGFGWARTLNTPTRAHTWMSITTDLGDTAGVVAHRLGGAEVDQTRQACWLAGLLVAAAVAGVLWWHSARIGPVTALGLCLTVFVVASPVVHPWYVLWGVVPLAAAARSVGLWRSALAALPCWSCPVGSTSGCQRSSVLPSARRPCCS